MQRKLGSDPAVHLRKHMAQTSHSSLIVSLSALITGSRWPQTSLYHPSGGPRKDSEQILGRQSSARTSVGSLWVWLACSPAVARTDVVLLCFTIKPLKKKTQSANIFHLKYALDCFVFVFLIHDDFKKREDVQCILLQKYLSFWGLVWKEKVFSNIVFNSDILCLINIFGI